MPGTRYPLTHPGCVFPPIHVFLKTVLSRNTWPGRQRICHSAASHWVLEKHTLRRIFCGGSSLGMLSASVRQGSRQSELGCSCNQGPSRRELRSWDGFSEMSQVRWGGRGLDTLRPAIEGGLLPGTWTWPLPAAKGHSLRGTSYEPNAGNTPSNWKRGPWSEGRTQCHAQASLHTRRWLPFSNQI